MRQILPLTSARFFAAALVLVFHYPRKHEIFPAGIAEFGYEPVTFFFILSGFVLTYAHGRRGGLNVSAGDFAKARMVRILPSYLLALLLSLPFVLKTINWQQFILVPTMLQAWWPAAALAWNSPAWSLSNEMFFYAAFPLLWMILLDRLPAIPALLLAAVSVALVAGLRMTTPSETSQWHHFWAYFPLLNFPQFILGIALGKLFLSDAAIPRPNAAIGISGAILTVVILAKPYYPWLANDIVLTILFSLIIYSLSAVTGIANKVMSGRSLVALGSASYALYILHGPVWLWWNHITNVVLKWNIEPHLDFVLYCSLAVLASIAVDVWLEKPVIRFFRRARQPSPAT